MSRISSCNVGGGESVFSILTIIFIVLKLIEVEPVAHWSWWWVISPSLIGLGFAILAFVIVILIAALTD
jgi:hypothetical protein